MDNGRGRVPTSLVAPVGQAVATMLPAGIDRFAVIQAGRVPTASIPVIIKRCAAMVMFGQYNGRIISGADAHCREISKNSYPSSGAASSYPPSIFLKRITAMAF